MRCSTGRIFSNRLLLTSVLLVASGAFLFAPPTWPQANVQGQWQTLPYTMPINPVHAALMPSGKILIVSGSGNIPANTNLQAAVWDPNAGTVTTQPLTWDMFCNGMIHLPDGRVFILGGTLQYDPFFGQPRTAMYDPTTGGFYRPTEYGRRALVSHRNGTWRRKSVGFRRNERNGKHKYDD